MKTGIFHHIKVRLTLWNIFIFGGILSLYALGSSWFFLTALDDQLNGSLKEELELVEQILLHAPDGSFPRDIHGEEIHELERYLEIWSMEGRLRYRSKILGDRALGGIPPAIDFPGGIWIRSVDLSDGARFRVAEKLGEMGGERIVIRLGVSEGGHFSDMYRFVLWLLVGMPTALLLVSIGAYRMAHRALKPIDTMVSTVRRIEAGNLSERIVVKHQEDELGRLASTFNDLLARVERSFARLKQFTADVSHELRTPLTAMRSVGEVGLQIGRSNTEYREVIGSMLEEADRLTRLIDNLMVLSRADLGQYHLKLERVELLIFARETTDLVSILAGEKHQCLNVQGDSGVTAFVDRTLLCQALMNVIDNAIKFTPERGLITVTVGRTVHREGFIRIEDSGPGIPPGEQEKIFDRFYRLTSSNGGGTGLGLAIARWAVEIHSGRIHVENKNGGGSIFQITLRPAENPS